MITNKKRLCCMFRSNYVLLKNIFLFSTNINYNISIPVYLRYLTFYFSNTDTTRPEKKTQSIWTFQ